MDIGTEIETVTVEPIEEPAPAREPLPELIPAEEPFEPALVPANLFTSPAPGCEQVGGRTTTRRLVKQG